MSKILVIVGVVGLLLGGLIGYVSHSQPAGTAIGYQTAQNSILLYNALSGIITDLTAVRAPLAGVISSASTTYSFGTVSAGNASSVDIATAGAAIGDICLASVATSTNAKFLVSCQVSGSGTSTVVVLASSSVNLGVPPVNVRVFPLASFAAPAALGSSATTTTN